MNLDLAEINRILMSISQRLNFMANDGDDVSASGKKFTNLEAGAMSSDAIRFDQALLLTNLVAVILGTADEVTVTDNGNRTITISLPNAIKLDGATASRLLATDANKKTASVAALSAWIAGTATELSVADDGDGTITLSIGLHLSEVDPHTQYQKEAEKDAVSGYAGLNASGRTTKGKDTIDDVIVDLATKGLVLKDTQATPHYWRVTVSVLGVLTTTDLGTVKP